MKPADLIAYNRELYEKGHKLVAIIDGALWPEAVDTMLDLEIEHSCLFTGDYDINIQCKLPHIFELSDDEFSQQFIGRMSEKFGMLCEVPEEMSLGKVRRALKKFIRAKLPDERQVNFRYYDPRVMTQFEKLYTPEQKQQIFTDVRQYYYLKDGGDVFTYKAA